MGRDARPRCRKRVTQRNCSSRRVELLTWNLQLALDGARLGSECLVDLDEIHVIKRQAGLVKSNLRGGNWTDSHHCGIHARNSPRNQTAERCESALAREFFTSDHERAGAVPYPRRISCCDNSCLSENRLQLRQCIESCIRTQMLIAIELFHLPR